MENSLYLKIINRETSFTMKGHKYASISKGILSEY